MTFDEAHLDALADALGGRAPLDALLAVYREDLRAQLARLEAAVADDEREDVRLAAHALRSGAASFGATELAAAARSLEARAGDGDAREQFARIAAIAD